MNDTGFPYYFKPSSAAPDGLYSFERPFSLGDAFDKGSDDQLRRMNEGGKYEKSLISTIYYSRQNLERIKSLLTQTILSSLPNHISSGIAHLKLNEESILEIMSDVFLTESNFEDNPDLIPTEIQRVNKLVVDFTAKQYLINMIGQYSFMKARTTVNGGKNIIDQPKADSVKGIKLQDGLSNKQDYPLVDTVRPLLLQNQILNVPT